MIATPIDQMRDRAGEVAGFLKALANENRLLILCVLLECGAIEQQNRSFTFCALAAPRVVT